MNKMELVRKLKVIKNPTRKSARQLLTDINKPNYECEITNKGIVKVKIFKNGVPMSLNDKNIETFKKMEGEGIV
jgi:hypothetical protein